MAYRPKMGSVSSVGSSAAVIEASAADLVLLNQGLGKSKKVSDRLATMLTSFDDRLLKLEKSLAPIHRDTSNLTRISSNIGDTLRVVERALGSHESALRQESVIKRGPRPDDISPYTTALDELVKSARDVQANRRANTGESAAHINSLIDMGARKLATVLIGWLKDSTGAPLRDANVYVVEGRPFPTLSTSRTTQLAGLLAYLRNIPGKVGKDVEAEVQQQYADVRSAYLAESLSPVAHASTAAAKQGGGGGMFASFLDCMFEMLKAEYTSAAGIFRGSALASVYGRIVPSTTGLLYETGQSLNSIVKRSLTSNVAVAFQAYETLRDRADLFDSEVRTKASRKDNELGELVHAFRGSCLRSLPEFVEETKSFGIKVAPVSEATNPAVAEMTRRAIEFMRQICHFHKTSEEFLTTLGEGNWVTPPAPPTAREASKGGLLEKYLYDLLTTLFNALDGRSRQLRLPSSAQTTMHASTTRTGPAAIFLINNVAYARRELTESPVADYLGEGGEAELNKRMRAAKAQYLIVWSPLIAALMDAGDDKGGFGLGAVKSALPGQQAGAERREVKDRFGRFNDAFEEVESLHKVARLEPGEMDMRNRLRDEVERMVVPTYGKFAQKHEGGQFSKNPSKYLKMTVEQLESKLNDIFDA